MLNSTTECIYINMYIIKIPDILISKIKIYSNHTNSVRTNQNGMLGVLFVVLLGTLPF